MTVVTSTVTGEGQQSQAQLLAIMKQVTHTDGHRWTVLEARDKYLRLRQPRSVTRSGADIKDMNLVGTCPDFCPEKERYGQEPAGVVREVRLRRSPPPDLRQGTLAQRR